MLYVKHVFNNELSKLLAQLRAITAQARRFLCQTCNIHFMFWDVYIFANWRTIEAVFGNCSVNAYHSSWHVKLEYSAVYSAIIAGTNWIANMLNNQHNMNNHNGHHYLNSSIPQSTLLKYLRWVSIQLTITSETTVSFTYYRQF